MTIIEHFSQLYNKHKNDDRIKAEKGTYEHFRIACKYLCGGNTTSGLNVAGVSGAEIAAGVENKIIKYEPRMGITRRESGYTLTAKGMKAVFAKVENE